MFYHTGTDKLVLSLDVEFVGGSAANIFVDVGRTQRSFSQANPASNPYTFTFPNPSWSVGDEVTVKIVVLEEANGPEELAATSAESGDGFDVTLTWDAPTGGGTVTGYRVEYQPDPALQWRTLESSQSGRTFTDSGLARGTVRYYRVAALRSGGASYSEIVRVQAESETTEVPGKVNFVDVKPAEGSDTALEVAWNRASTPNSRAPATGYNVQYARHDGAAPAVRDGEDWATVTFPRWMERLPWRNWSGVVEEIEFEESTERSAHLKTVVTGLAPGTNYRVRVRGCTETEAGGCGEWSYPRRWTTSGATLNATEAEPLTAMLEDFPTNHDGSSAFTFRIAFSAEVEITPENMRDHALTVTGGTVTNATQVDGRSDLWELTVEPAGTGAVSILVPLDRACTETGALCTADGQMLTTASGHSVPGPAPSLQGQQALAPLAAGFVSVPPEHDGETEFWLELSFGAAVVRGSKPRIQALLGATGGSVTRMRRKDGRLDHWRIRIQPSSHEAVTVTLSPSPACGAAGAVCTEDGRTFTTALATQIQGPPGLAVADAEVEEAANAALAFAVTLSRAPSGTVTVYYATSDGTATAGSDYTATSGTLTFAAGETAKTVSVPVLDDAHDEGSETLSLTLSNASGAYLEDGTATGTINNTDPIPQPWLARFGRTAAEHVLDGVQARLSAPRNPGMQANVAGLWNLGTAADTRSDTPADTALAAPGEAPQDGLRAHSDWIAGGLAGTDPGTSAALSLTARDLITGSAFAVTGETAGGGFAAVWGRGAYSSFEGQDSGVTLDGELTTAMLGADYASGRWIAGVSLSVSEGEGTYGLDGKEGELDSSLTGVYPYVGYDINERLSAWGVAGYGEGNIKLTQPDTTETIRTGIDLAMVAVGARGDLMPRTEAAGFDLALTSDALMVRTTSAAAAGLAATDADVSRLRLGLDGSWLVPLDSGASLTPSIEIGMRHDGGDAETGFGVDLGGGLAYADEQSGLGLELNARALLAHEDENFREWGVSGALIFDPDPSSDRGLSLSVGPSWGASATGGAEALLGPETMSGLALDNTPPPGGRLGVEAAWGFPALAGRYTGTPYLGLGLREGGRDLRLGWRLGAVRREGLELALGLEGTRLESNGRSPEHGATVRLMLRW